MKVQYVDVNGNAREAKGLLGMKPKERAGRLVVVHTNIITLDSSSGGVSGRCTSLAGNKRAAFVALKGSEIHVGSLGAEFLLGVRIDEPEEIRTRLVCKCGLKEFGEPELKFRHVREFIQKICEEGYLPQHHEEVPRTLLDVLRCYYGRY